MTNADYPKGDRDLTGASRDPHCDHPPTFFGVFTTPNGADVRRYYEERAERRQRWWVIYRIAALRTRSVSKERPGRAR